MHILIYLNVDLISKKRGLSSDEATKLLRQYGENKVEVKEDSMLSVLFNQFKSPLIYLLLLASGISFYNHEIIDGFVVLTIILVNATIGFYQEFKAKNTLKKLQNFITSNIRTFRDGKLSEIDKKNLVPGDVIYVKLGDVVPADSFILEQESLLVDESSLSGESTPVSKVINDNEDENSVNGILYSGSAIKQGSAIVKVFKTGKQSKFGQISNLSLNTVKITEYEENLKNVTKGFILISIISLGAIFFLHLALGKGESISQLLIFTIAIAITIIPEALPIVTTLTLTKNAYSLGKKGVIVKRASSVEDLGNIDVLCTDKTGTLTENHLQVREVDGDDEEKLLAFAFMSSAGSDDPFDLSIAEFLKNKNVSLEVPQYKEIPFNPEVKYSERIFEEFTIRKGVPEIILNQAKPDNYAEILDLINQKEQKGYRAIAIGVMHAGSEQMNFLGTLFFVDSIKADVQETIAQAKAEGIVIKVISGDSLEVSRYVGKQVSIISDDSEAVESSELDFDNEERLLEQVQQYSVFARTDPTQKYKIIQSLQKVHHVGYIGDGINDAPSLRLANVSIVVNNASDIAKSSADIILTQKDLGVITEGILQGRKAFENINKYVKQTLIGNFGNFITVGLLSVFLDFLPMLPLQILLCNLLTDFPTLAISTDNVDDFEIRKPKHHNLKSILRIALILGLTSSLFDFIFFFTTKHAAPVMIQTKWFVFSTLTEIWAIFSIRSRRSIFLAKPPSKSLVFLAFACVAIVVGLGAFGLSALQIVQIPLMQILFLIVLSLLYLFTSEIVKVGTYKYLHHKNHRKKIQK